MTTSTSDDKKAYICTGIIILKRFSSSLTCLIGSQISSSSHLKVNMIIYEEPPLLNIVSVLL